MSQANRWRKILNCNSSNISNDKRLFVYFYYSLLSQFVLMILNFQNYSTEEEKKPFFGLILQIFRERERVQFMVYKLRITKTAVNIMTTQRFSVHCKHLTHVMMRSNVYKWLHSDINRMKIEM